MLLVNSKMAFDCSQAPCTLCDDKVVLAQLALIRRKLIHSHNRREIEITQS